MHVKSKDGEIGVYLCSEHDDQQPSSGTVSFEDMNMDDDTFSLPPRRSAFVDGFSMLDLDETEFQFALDDDEGIVNLFAD